MSHVFASQLRRANIATHNEVMELSEAVRRIDNTEVLDAIRTSRAAADLGAVLDAIRGIPTATILEALSVDSDMLRRVQLDIRQLRESLVTQRAVVVQAAQQISQPAARPQVVVNEVGASHVIGYRYSSPPPGTVMSPVPVAYSGTQVMSPRVVIEGSPGTVADQWWINYGVTPAGQTQVNYAGVECPTFHISQQEQFGCDECGNVLDKAKFDAAINMLTSSSWPGGS